MHGRETPQTHKTPHSTPVAGMQPGQTPLLAVIHTSSEQHLSTNSAYVTSVTNTTMQKAGHHANQARLQRAGCLHTIVQERAGCVCSCSTKSNEVPMQKACSRRYAAACFAAFCAMQHSSTLCTDAWVCMPAGCQTRLWHHKQDNTAGPCDCCHYQNKQILCSSAQAQQPLLHAAAV